MTLETPAAPNADALKNAESALDAVVRFINVQKTYDAERLVVRNLNLDIRRGEFLTMLGPSGSGKTTTLMMLAGFEPATHGEILLNGRQINRVPPNKRGIGMVFQNYALFPHLTVAENLAFPLQVRSVAKMDVEKRVERALALVEMQGFGARRPAQLSGGQQQRIAVARALIFEPDVVLMDEPLGALDKQLREQMQYEIKHLHDRLGVTIVYVTHDQGEALTMSDRIAVFNDGAIQQLSTPSDLYERPTSLFVAEFIGENNRLSGRIEQRDGGGACAVRLSGGQLTSAVAVDDLRPGDAALLLLRPERIVLQSDPSQVSDDAMEATVEEVIYLGDHIRVRVTVPGQPPLVVKTLDNGGRALDKGDRVSIRWRPDYCRAIRPPKDDNADRA